MKKPKFKKLLKVISSIFLVIIVIGGLVFIGRQTFNFVQNKAIGAIDYATQSIVSTGTDAHTENIDEMIDTENNIDDELSNVLLEFRIGNENLLIDTSISYETYELDSLYSDQSIPVEIVETSNSLPEGTTVHINNQNLQEIDEIDIQELQTNNFIEIEIKSGDLSRKYYIQTLPSDFPAIEKVGESDYPGIYYTSIYPNEPNNNSNIIKRDAPYIIKMSEDGEILYYKRNDEQNLANFQRWDIDGNIRQTYFEENKQAGVAEGSGYSYGKYVVMDEEYNEIDTIEALPSSEYEIGNTTIDHHDFIYIDDGHYIVSKYLHTHPHSEHTNENLLLNSNITAAYIQEIKDDEIVWEWNSIDYPEFYDSSVEGNDYLNNSNTSADYVHINSTFIDPSDNNLIMSFRNQDSVVKVDRKNGDIEWILGGENDQFNLADNQMFSRQHHATITEAGNLILFDNGNENQQTRILEFGLDEENMEVLDFEEFKVDDYFARFTGSVQKINEENDVFTIGWGMSRNHANLMSEIDFKNGEVQTEVITNNIEDDTYRFLKYEE